MAKAVAELIAAGPDRETNSRDAGLVAVGRNSFVKMTPRMGAADAQWRLRAGMNAVLREARLRACAPSASVRLTWINPGPEPGTRIDMCVTHGFIVGFSRPRMIDRFACATPVGTESPDEGQ